MVKATLFFLLLIFNFGFSQKQVDNTKDFYENISKKYLQKEVLNYSYIVKQYDESGLELLKTINGEISQSKNKYSYDLEDIKVVFQDSFYLIIYKNRKEIYYHILSNELMENSNNFDINNLIKTLKQNNIKVEKAKSDNTTDESYYLIFGNLEKSLYTIFIDKNSGYIKNLKISYYDTNKKQEIGKYIIEIIYSNYNIISSDKFFPLDEYVINVNGELIKKELFKDYKLFKF